MFKVLSYIFLVTVFSVQVSASDWSVAKEKSQIKFSGTHAGNAFEGVFRAWQADIFFDPEDLTSAHVTVKIQTGTATTGNGLYDGTLKGDDWFNIQRYREAIFVASSFQALGGNQYEADGTLTIRETSLPLKLAFSLTIDGKQAAMKAEHSLDRIAYGLGVKSDAEAAWVSREIGLSISLSASR